MSLGIRSIQLSCEMRVFQTLTWKLICSDQAALPLILAFCKTFLPRNIKPLLFFHLEALLRIHALSCWTGLTMLPHAVCVLTLHCSSLCATQSYPVPSALYAEGLFTTWLHEQCLWVLFDYNNDNFSNTVALGSTTQHILSGCSMKYGMMRPVITGKQ